MRVGWGCSAHGCVRRGDCQVTVVPGRVLVRVRLRPRLRRRRRTPSAGPARPSGSAAVASTVTSTRVTPGRRDGGGEGAAQGGEELGGDRVRDAVLDRPGEVDGGLEAEHRRRARRLPEHLAAEGGRGVGGRLLEGEDRRTDLLDRWTGARRRPGRASVAPSRCAAARRWVDSSIMPVANSRWTTRSCRSRAIRSRSSYTASRSRWCWASARTSARAACEANWVASSRSTAVYGRSPRRRGRASVPISRPPACSGSSMLGPNRCRTWVVIRGSVAESSMNTGSPPRSWTRTGLPGRDGGADDVAGVVERGGGHDLHAALLGGLEDDPREASARVPGPFGDRHQRVGGGLAGEQRGGDGGGALDPALALPGRLVQPGVADRDAGLRGQHPQHCRVLVA